MREVECRTCHGQRLKPEILAVKVHGHNIAQINSMTIDEAIDLFAKLKLTKREETIARRVVKEIVERLTFLMDVGLDYLTLSRASATLVGRRGAAHPPGQSDRQLPRRACSTCWTSRRSDCTSATTAD